MPETNRVTPRSEIVALPLRGRWMGNRGCLHEMNRVVRPFNGRRWIVCALDFRARSVEQWAPGRYTVLFFHDEAVALAAGHRPCAECRRPAYREWGDAWERALGTRVGADEMDRQLHQDRLTGRYQRHHRRAWRDVPAGVFVLMDDQPARVTDHGLVPWSPLGYLPARDRPSSGEVVVLTPQVTVEVLRHGFRPDVDPSTR
ncbi:MAG: hypothetical protein ACT4PW_14325 [Acidimicrobiia bacterium]